MSGKSGFNGQGFMFLSPYYGKSKTSEILDRGMELDKINAARKKKLAAAKAAKPNNWQPGQNSTKVHAKFQESFNSIIGQNYDWAVSQGQKLNKGHEEYNANAWSEWMKRKNGEVQLAQFFADQVTEHETFYDQYSELDDKDNPVYNRSSLAYAPLNITLSDWKEQEKMRGNQEWEGDYFQGQQILKDESGIPIPMGDGSNRIQTVNGGAVNGYDGFNEVIEDRRPEKLMYNMAYNAVDNMNPGEWVSGPGGKIYYQGKEYYDSDSFDFGENLYKKSFDGNPTDAFIGELDQWELGNEHYVNGRIKRRFLNNVSNQIIDKLNYKVEQEGNKKVSDYSDGYAQSVYQNMAYDYYKTRGNNNPSPTMIQSMITDSKDFRLAPNQQWTSFIEDMGWDTDGSGKDKYNFQNYVVYKTMEQYLDKVGNENLTDNANSDEMFTYFNKVSNIKLGESSWGVHGNGASAGEDSAYTNTPTFPYGYNHIYNNGKKKTDVMFSIQPNEHQMPNVYIEGLPTPYSRDGKQMLDLKGLNVEIEGSWQNIQGMVLREIEPGSGKMQFVEAGKDLDNDDTYVPMIKMLVKSDQISVLMKKYAEEAGGIDGFDKDQKNLYELMKALKDKPGHTTMWVPLEQVYDYKGTQIGRDWAASQGGKHVEEFNSNINNLSSSQSDMNDLID